MQKTETYNVSINIYFQIIYRVGFLRNAICDQLRQNVTIKSVCLISAQTLAGPQPSSRAVNANQFAKLLVFNPPNWPLPLPEQWPLENTIHGVMDPRPGCWPLIGGGQVWWPNTGPWLVQSGENPRRHCWWQVATSVLMEAGNGNKKWNYILAPQHSDISSVRCLLFHNFDKNMVNIHNSHLHTALPFPSLTPSTMQRLRKEGNNNLGNLYNLLPSLHTYLPYRIIEVGAIIFETLSLVWVSSMSMSMSMSL